ncbi:MAG: hypothetical protein Q9199_000825 [Rusavskia elegans]
MSLLTVPPRPSSGNEFAFNTPSGGDLLVPPMPNLASSSGESIDPTDPRYKIRWKFDGLVVTSPSIYTALIDALTTLASQNHGESFREVVGHSFNDGAESVVVSIVRKSGQAVDHDIVISAFQELISKAVYGREDLEDMKEMDFQLLHDNVEVALGVVFKPKRPGNTELPAGSASS